MRASGIRYVTQAQRHAGQDGRVLAARHAVNQDARQTQPATLERADPQLDTGWRASPSIRSVTLLSGRQHHRIQLSGSIGVPLFSVPTWGPSIDWGIMNESDMIGRVCCRLGTCGWNGRCVWLGRRLMVSLEVST